MPPIFNQDDGQLVKGVTVGALGQVTERWQVLANVGYLDATLETQNVGQQRQAPDADAGVLGQPLDDATGCRAA